MVVNILIWLVQVLLTVFFIWLVFRSGRARNGLARWGGRILSGLLALVFAAVTFVSAKGMVTMYRTYNVPVPDVSVAGTPEQIARGEHLASMFCASCHSPTGNPPLIGGVNMGKDIPMPLGGFYSINLTPAGPLKNWSDGELMRLFRAGLTPSGHLAVFMSTVNVRYMSDEDLHSVIAYLRSLPAVENQTPQPPDQPTFLAAIMLGAGLVPIRTTPLNGEVSAPPKAPTAEYGEYVLSFQDCRGCHGSDLSGGKKGQLAPLGPNLRVVKGWTNDQFISTLRNGVDPSGHQLSEVMPWKQVGLMDEVELQAVHAYLSSLP